MIIELLVDGKNHKAGAKINVEYIYAQRMISSGTAKEFVETVVENVVVVETPIIQEEVVPKRKGNPNWGKKK